MSDRLISLAAGVCPETPPAEFVTACATAGWPGCGIWFDPETWTDAVAREVRLRLDDTGVVPLDMEPIFVTPNGDHGDRVIDAAAVVGASNLLVVSRGVDEAAFTERFAELCDRAATHGIGCSIEFMAFMTLRTLPEALRVLDVVNRPNGSVLIDNLHLARTGGTADDVRAVDAARLPYAQLCDAAAAPPEDLIVEALDERLLPGAGGLGALEFVRAFPPTTALSLEVRSATLRRDFPDATDRARHVRDKVSDTLLHPRKES